MSMHLGDFAEDASLHFTWDSFDSSGASVTRSTDGTISVYKDNGVSQSVAGITDAEDFDGLTGIHACTIDLSSDAFYATGSNYSVVLSAATIDSQTVNATLATFSIENRSMATAQAAIDTIVAAVVTAQGEPAQGAPAVSASMDDKIAYLYKAWRNRTTTTATTYSVYADDATTVDHKATLSDDLTTLDKTEMATGP